jgi:hypothetical protein
MSSVVISGDSSGSVSLTVPSVAGSNTATLPAATGTVMVSGNMPAFSAYLNSSQSIANATFTKVQCNIEEYDTNSNYDNATNYRFTPTVAGYYQVNGSIGFGSGTTGLCISTIYKNGTRFKDGVVIAYSTNGTSSTASALIYFNGSTDYIEMYGYQSQGTSTTLSGTANSTYFQATMVRSA